MSRAKSKPDTPARKWHPSKGILGLALLLAACGDPAPVRTEGPLIRVANVTDYAWRDRNGSGQPVDLKPAAERDALYRELSIRPSTVLVLRGLGSEASLRHLRDALAAEAGVVYEHLFYLPGDTPYAGIGFLSRLPLQETRSLSDQTYRVREREFRPLAGGVKIGTADGKTLWIWNSQWPDPGESYERRRNEARLLAQTLRPLVQAGDAVLLSLHSREERNSPMFRLLEEAGFRALAATDERGDGWTHLDPRGLIYRQDQWLFASPALAESDAWTAGVSDSADIRTAGEYRHQWIDFRP
jgi:hypothetical protein